jgi:hypothetical protein
MLIQHDLNLARIGTKDANLQIVPNPVRTQHPKGIGMRPADEAAHFVRGQSSDLERFHDLGLQVKKLKELQKLQAHLFLCKQCNFVTIQSFIASIGHRFNESF